MSKIIRKNRQLAFEEQNGRCYYCRMLMWLGNVSEFADEHRISKGLARQLQCTAEHLLPRQDGGTNERANIVAACYFCNSTRHRALNPQSPEQYQKKVTHRMRHLKWHPIEIDRLMKI